MEMLENRSVKTVNLFALHNSKWGEINWIHRNSKSCKTAASLPKEVEWLELKHNNEYRYGMSEYLLRYPMRQLLLQKT